MILLDSSFIVAYSNEADGNHEKAFLEMENIEKGDYGSPTITDYIFDEVTTVILVKTRNLKRAVDLGEKLLSATILFRVDGDVFYLAWKLFKEQRELKFSFTDCTSIALCKTNGISNIATFDRDFKTLLDFKTIGL